ncbi:mitochondrial ribosomal protein L52 [Lycorma delicatula]|uniref:mitochondrial ribosomal protein L52 n=1 Tax=Lycorma delicatula TaxID=130591 RepID=UPI003F5120CF
MMSVYRYGRLSVMSNFVPCRNYNPTNKINREGRKWREQHKLPSHINHHKSLLDGADYRFLDGRLTPYGSKQYRRLLAQRSLAEQIVEFKGEVDFAVDRFKRIEEEKKQEIKNILNKKLKPKGGFLK